MTENGRNLRGSSPLMLPIINPLITLNTMTTMIINGIECMPCPIDGKNLNDCWAELFEDFTDCVIGKYHKFGIGHFAFMMSGEGGSIFNFSHIIRTNTLVFYMVNGTTPWERDINRLKAYMQDICDFCTDDYRGMFVEIEDEQPTNTRFITFRFYHYSK